MADQRAAERSGRLLTVGQHSVSLSGLTMRRRLRWPTQQTFHYPEELFFFFASERLANVVFVQKEEKPNGCFAESGIGDAGRLRLTVRPDVGTECSQRTSTADTHEIDEVNESQQTTTAHSCWRLRGRDALLRRRRAERRLWCKAARRRARLVFNRSARSA